MLHENLLATKPCVRGGLCVCGGGGGGEGGESWGQRRVIADKELYFALLGRLLHLT